MPKYLFTTLICLFSTPRSFTRLRAATTVPPEINSEKSNYAGGKRIKRNIPVNITRCRKHKNLGSISLGQKNWRWWRRILTFSGKLITLRDRSKTNLSMTND